MMILHGQAIFTTRKNFPYSSLIAFPVISVDFGRFMTKIYTNIGSPPSRPLSQQALGGTKTVWEGGRGVRSALNIPLLLRKWAGGWASLSFPPIFAYFD